MKRLLKTGPIAAAIFIAALNFCRAQQVEMTAEIEKTLRDYLTAMSSRDVEGLRSVMDKRLAVIEAGRTNAKVGFLDTSNGKELLPPEGNHDWDKDKIRLASVKVEISATHSSVAMASFTLSFPLTDKRVADLEALLKQTPAAFGDQQRKAAQQMITDRAIHNAMFAMLALENGRWKIVCMSFPK